MVWFTNDERGLVLNKTNNRTIRGAFGDDTADWIGKIIVVFPTMTDFRGKMAPALRVRIPPPKQAQRHLSTAALTASDTAMVRAPAPADRAAAAPACRGGSRRLPQSCRGSGA